MGISLRLYPLDHLQGNFGYCHSMLELGTISHDVCDEIRPRARRLPDGHNITAYDARCITDGTHKGERLYGKLECDSYGEPYCWLTASELMGTLLKHWPKSPITAYVGALPPDRLIVLDWH